MSILEKAYILFSKGSTICTDSRNIEVNSIFIALKGDNFDGNNFVDSAISKGAAIAISDCKTNMGKPNVEIVSDSLVFLQDLAKLHRSKLRIPVIGLTGSNGKTTTKELIASVLKKKFNVLATKGNLNNHIGVPLTVLSINADVEIAIVEMGANHIGEIGNLCSIAQPTHGLITNIGKAHLEGFGSFEGVKIAKSELYKHISENNGNIFINSSDSILIELASKHKVKNLIGYGREIFDASCENTKAGTLKLKIIAKGDMFTINSQLVGNYNTENILAAIRIGEFFGVDYPIAINAIEEYTPSNNRSQIEITPHNEVVLDAYNANPSSMDAAITNFASIQTEKPKAVILGEMLELGQYSMEEHTRIADIAKKHFKDIILLGSNFSHIQGVSHWFPSYVECAEYIKANPFIGYKILIKGSRGVRLENLLQYL
jgi:UDP-N-acetylmuramoyl-tripeptide--D-alanyl-D-alanine ligase